MSWTSAAESGIRPWAYRELDLLAFFGLTPPSVHSMIVKLHQLGLVSRKPGEPRSVRVTVAKEQLPELEDVAGPPW